MTKTLTFSNNVNGWVSFYSFFPEQIRGMNNYLYTFKGGNLFRHNTNEVRNNFYGVQYPSQITSVFNDAPLENKLFKTIVLQGDDTWSATFVTDLQNGGFIEADWFDKKESAYFAFMRDNGTTPASTSEYPLRSLNGIGRSLSFDDSDLSAVIVNYSISPLVSIGKITSVGDLLYFAPPPYDTPQLFGQITDIIVDYPNGINRIIVDSTITGGGIPLIQTPYTLAIKNAVAESHGVLGHYCKFVLENDNTSKVELFVIESEIMKSYP